MGAMPTIKEMVADMEIVEPPVAPVEPAISWAPSMPKVAHDMVELDRFMHNFIEAATIKIKEMEKMEKKKKDAEISCLKIELESAQGAHESAQAGLKSAQADLESALSDLDVVHAKLGAVCLEVLSLQGEEEMTE
ncbi:hypothetical protein COCNU_04G016060 [Cocos nucifera]|uniref:Uncharacterized protein n=1 Tax=Cocos nucifera TaxID=13894 RepID=A0A8K0I7E2_COCNU|nr:hypothetical protein COCNU_04G016060 [Cocos nucifera]